MNIDIALAKREYCLEFKITDHTTVAKLDLQFVGLDSLNQAVFEIYKNGESVPVTWALKKVDVTGYEVFVFPKNILITPLSVANFINSRSGVGMKYDDIEYIHELAFNKYQVMMSLDSMYFTNYFIMRTA